MRPTNSGTTSYQPGIVPDDPAQLPRFLREELIKLKTAYDALADGFLPVSYAAPSKPRAGMLRNADGVYFKPNGTGGAGIWYYNGTIWVQLG